MSAPRPFSTSDMDQKIRVLGATASKGAEKGLFLAAEHVLGVSNDHVPIEEGTLERSGATHVDGLTGYVYYDTPYAIPQHEDLTLRHDAGRTAKYLENALTGEKEACRQIIVQAIRGQLG